MPAFPPQRRLEAVTIEVGARWYSRGTGGHAAGAAVVVAGLSRAKVYYRPLSSHARRGGRVKSLSRAQFLVLFGPRKERKAP